MNPKSTIEWNHDNDVIGFVALAKLLIRLANNVGDGFGKLRACEEQTNRFAGFVQRLLGLVKFDELLVNLVSQGVGFQELPIGVRRGGESVGDPDLLFLEGVDISPNDAFFPPTIDVSSEPHCSNQRI